MYSNCFRRVSVITFVPTLGAAAAQEAMTRRQDLELAVKLDGGRMLAVTKAADQSSVVGDRVRVLTGATGIARVIH